MANLQPYRIKSISEFHRFRGLPKPEHPLISVVDYGAIRHLSDDEPVSLVFDFYSIALKQNLNGKISYGQQEYDFDEGLMYFIAPNQVLGIHGGKEIVAKRSGWILLVHPDFLWNTPLAKQMRRYEYFDYSVHEALFLSEKEEGIMASILQNVRQEYYNSIDKFSHDIIIAQLALLLTYSERFYQRQFLTRRITSHKIVERLEEWLTDYFGNDDLIRKGLPSVQSIAESLAVSPNYLSSLLKTLTGQSTQQHVHNKLIEKAKEKLSVTNLSVSEIAYELGFEHPQSFSKLFKTKTNLSPMEFRQSFN